MSAADNKPNLLGYSRQDLIGFFDAWGERPFRASQITKWIHQRGVIDFDSMTDLSRALRERLVRETEMRLPQVESEQRSTDGTRKWLLRLADGNAIETVFIPEEDRGTLCISSQVGCALDCTFCSTARQGFNRNLGADEIIAQLWIARRALDESPKSRTVTNVVLMGMGEPLLNFEPVVTAIRIMQDDLAYGLGKRRVTLSTSGYVPGLDKLKQAVDVSLAVSLHAPNDALRNRLVPINRKYPIAELLAASRRYLRENDRKQRVTFEYVMLDGVNDSETHARELVALLRDYPAKVNLIPFNPFPGAGYERSSASRIDRFRKILLDSGINTITRKTRGDDIDAACGQLVGRVDDRSHRTMHFKRLEQRLAS